MECNLISQPQLWAWENEALNRLADYITQGNWSSQHKIIGVKQNLLDASSFLFIWTQRNGEIRETKVCLDRKNKAFCFRNGGPHVESIETLLSSIFSHCDLSN